jgi:hypothetical protein
MEVVHLDRNLPRKRIADAFKPLKTAWPSSPLTRNAALRKLNSLFVDLINAPSP